MMTLSVPLQTLKNHPATKARYGTILQTLKRNDVISLSVSFSDLIDAVDTSRAPDAAIRFAVNCILSQDIINQKKTVNILSYRFAELYCDILPEHGLIIGQFLSILQDYTKGTIEYSALRDSKHKCISEINADFANRAKNCLSGLAETPVPFDEIDQQRYVIVCEALSKINQLTCPYLLSTTVDDILTTTMPGYDLERKSKRMEAILLSWVNDINKHHDKITDQTSHPVSLGENFHNNDFLTSP